MLKVQKKIVESSVFNLLNVYSGFIVGLFSTFLIARLITPEEWSYLLIAQSLIGTLMIICTFFPPGAESSISHYIPHLIIKNGKKSTEIRRFFFHIYKFRFISMVIVYIIFLMSLYFFNFNLELNQIILIISPTLFFNIFICINNAFFLAFQKFKLIFSINLINSILYTFLVFLISILQIHEELVFLAYITLFSSVFSYLISTFFIIPLIPKKKENSSDLYHKTRISFFDIHKNYGINLAIEGLLSHITTLILSLIFLNSGFAVFIIYLAICEKVVSFALNFSISNRNFYISIFSEIHYQKDIEIFKKSFYQLSKYLFILTFFIVSTLFYFIEIYIEVIYSETYLVIMTAIQIFLFTAISRLLTRNLLIISQSTNNTRINTEMALFRTFFNLTFIIIGLLYYNFTILVIFYLFASYLLTVVLFYLINKRTKVKLKFFKIFKSVIIFLVSFLISFIISYLIDFQILAFNQFFNIILNSTIKLLIFFIVFYVVIVLTKFITKEELNQIVDIIPILNSENRSIQKTINFIKFLFPSSKNS